MLRAAFGFLSSFQVGLRAKESVERVIKRVIIAAVGVVILLIAVFFGLLAAYNALVLSYGFDPIEAAGLVGGALLLIGIVILAIAPLVTRAKKPPSPAQMAEEGIGMVDQQMSRVVQQVGPVTLVAIAFAAGLLASRRR
jgi:hypothetical protein